jgi:hypothetical protein
LQAVSVVRKLNDSQLTVIAGQCQPKLLQTVVSDLPKINSLNFASCNLRLDDWIFCQRLSQRRIGQTVLNDHLLAAEKANVAVACHLRCAITQLCFDPIGCLNRIVHHKFGNPAFLMRLGNGSKVLAQMVVIPDSETINGVNTP